MKTKHMIPLVVSALFCVALSVAVVGKLAAPKEEVEEVINVVPQQNNEKSIVTTFPANNQVVDILKPNVIKYINAMHEQAKAIENDYVLHSFYAYADSDGENLNKEYSNETDVVRIADYAKTKLESRSKSVSLVFDSEGFEKGTTFVVKVGLQPDLSDAISIETTETFATIDNLLSGTKYYWQVSQESVTSEISSFTTRDGFRMIRADGIQNIRDMGGRSVYGGKHIKQGLIFRGGELVEANYIAGGSTHYKTLNDENKKILRDELQIKYEIDFRGDEESNNLVNSALYDEDNYSDIKYQRIPNMSAYDYVIVQDHDYWPSIKEMFEHFINAENEHVYFHCWGGADRTGTAGFLLGAVLGMSLTDLIVDYELTSFAGNYRPHNQNDGKHVYRFPQLMYQLMEGESFAPYRGEGKLLRDVVTDFLQAKTGLTDEQIVQLRTNLLED